MMISTAVLVLALAASGLSLPLTTQKQISPESERVSEIEKQGSVATVPEKTEVESSPEETPIEQVQSSCPVPKIENIPVNVDKPKSSFPENPILLPIQPLNIMPLEQPGSVLRPVVVPVEAITPESIIKVAIPIQQGGYTEEIIMIDTYQPVQTRGVESKESQYIQRKEERTPVQQEVVSTEQLIREQVAQVKPVPGKVEEYPVSVDEIYCPPESDNPVTVEKAEKNVPHKVEEGYVPVQTVQQPVQKAEEKQDSPVQSQEGELENRNTEYDPYSVKPVVSENVENRRPEQQSREKQREDSVEKTERREVKPDTPENRPVNRQTYKPESAVEKEEEKKKVRPDTPVKKEPMVQETYDVEPVAEKQWENDKKTFNAESAVEKEEEKKQVSPDASVQREPVVQDNVRPVVEKQGQYQTQLTEPQQQEVETKKGSKTCVGQAVC